MAVGCASAWEGQARCNPDRISFIVVCRDAGRIDELAAGTLTELANQRPLVKVRQPAVRSSREEIKAMDWLIEDVERNGPATTPEKADQASRSEL